MCWANSRRITTVQCIYASSNEVNIHKAMITSCNVLWWNKTSNDTVNVMSGNIDDLTRNENRSVNIYQLFKQYSENIDVRIGCCCKVFDKKTDIIIRYSN